MIDYDKLEEMAQPGWFSKYDMQVLVPEVEKLTEGQIYVEIGVHKGRSLSVVDMTKQADIRMIGVDVLRQPELKIYLDKQENNKVGHWWADSFFASIVFKHLTEGGRVQLLFIDGDHSRNGVRRDIIAWHSHMAPNGIMLFHDYDESSPGVIQAVDEFATREGYSVETFNTPDMNTSMAKIQL